MQPEAGKNKTCYSINQRTEFFNQKWKRITFQDAFPMCKPIYLDCQMLTKFPSSLHASPGANDRTASLN